MVPETRYALTRDGVHVAYQVLGEPEPDLLFVTSWTSHLELQWEEPLIAMFLTRLAAMGRLVLYDKRGVGLSDPVVVDDGSNMVDWLPDIDGVLDAAGVERAVVIGFGAGGPLSAMYAATRAERVEKLVLINAWARWRWAEDHPFGVRPGAERAMIGRLEKGWGTGDVLATSAPYTPTGSHIAYRLSQADMLACVKMVRGDRFQIWLSAEPELDKVDREKDELVLGFGEIEDALLDFGLSPSPQKV